MFVGRHIFVAAFLTLTMLILVGCAGEQTNPTVIGAQADTTVVVTEEVDSSIWMRSSSDLPAEHRRNPWVYNRASPMMLVKKPNADAEEKVSLSGVELPEDVTCIDWEIP